MAKVENCSITFIRRSNITFISSQARSHNRQDQRILGTDQISPLGLRPIKLESLRNPRIVFVI